MIFRASFLELVRSLICRLLLFCRQYSRQLRALVFFLSLLACLELIWTISRTTPATRLLKGSGGSELTDTYKQKIYIVALHWNDEELLRKHWAPSLLYLVRHWDPENIYVSISESGSWDGTKDALRILDYELEILGVERNIDLSNRTHEDEVNREPGPNEPGWIRTPRGKLEMRRIPFLAAQRNKAMEKLKELAFREDKPRTFDKVLWLNDVIFNTDQVTALINTNQRNYAAACSLDFSSPPKLYDTFALRDIDGNPAISLTWPFFSSSTSRYAITSYSAVPVQSCWNGMVVLDALPFYNDPPLSFRAIPDSLAEKHVEGSECCLIHVDNPLVEEKGVWVNPNVRVTYNEAANEVVNPRIGGWPSSLGKVGGIWGLRWSWWTGWLGRWYAGWKVESRLKAWEVENEEESEKGRICLVDEMQVLLGNGWMHL